MTPQHLQQQDDFHEARLETRLAALGPYGFGVQALELDAAALAGGQLQVNRFEGMLPDGLPLRFARGDAECPPARPVESSLGSARSLDIYLGVPKVREGIDTYVGGEAVSSTQSRYTVVARPIADALAASSQVPVSFARPNVRILFGNETREDFSCLKIGEVIRDKLGALVLDESFIPPVLRLDASGFLMEGLRRTTRTMLAKQRDLADSRRHRDASTIEFTSTDVTRYLQLTALNATIPVLHHLAEAGTTHPYILYLQLLQAAGQLSTFVPDSDPLSLPAFQFTSLNATFAPLFDRLTAVLKQVAPEQSISVPLEHRPGGLHLGRLDDERLARCTHFVLTVKSEVPEAQVAEQLPKLSKVASPKDMQRIVKAAAPGVPLQATLRPPPQIPVRAGQVYFTLGTNDGYWKNAVSEQMVVFFIPPPFDSKTSFELLAVPGDSRTERTP